MSWGWPDVAADFIMIWRPVIRICFVELLRLLSLW